MKDTLEQKLARHKSHMRRFVGFLIFQWVSCWLSLPSRVFNDSFVEVCLFLLLNSAFLTYVLSFADDE